VYVEMNCAASSFSEEYLREKGRKRVKIFI